MEKPAERERERERERARVSRYREGKAKLGQQVAENWLKGREFPSNSPPPTILRMQAA
jgi:hypothetical protein